MGVSFDNLVWLFSKGGFIMYLLALISVISIAIIFERIVFYHFSCRINKNFVDKCTNYISNRMCNEAIVECNNDKSIMSDVVLCCATGVNEGKLKNSIEKEVENKCNNYSMKLSNGLNYLSMIASIAPMLGFLGTITGLIRSFIEMSNVEGNITPKILAGGLHEAMMTTAAGLATSIIADVAFRLLSIKKNKMLSQVEDMSNKIIDLLNKILPQGSI